MRKAVVFIFSGLFFLLSVFFSAPVQAQSDQINTTYQTGTVIKIISQQAFQNENKNFYTQRVEVRSDSTGAVQAISFGSEFQPLGENQKLEVGSKVIISLQQVTSDTPEFVITDVYRIPILVALALVFVLFVAVIGGRQGVLSIVGMIFSLFVLIAFIVPHILAGESPFLITLLGATATAVVTMYVSHGFKRQSHIALFSMLLCLAAAALLSNLVVQLGHFVGLGSEDAMYLQFGVSQHINLRGLLLAGILLGTLGILDDITLAQTAVIEQLKSVHPKITFSELYERGITVGKDHVASLVNTLVFAYAGTSLPLFLLFTLNRTQPTWVLLNSELIAEEIVRTLVGSIALIMAVPITTCIAAYYVTHLKDKTIKNVKKDAP